MTGEPASSQGAGERLRAAREQAGLRPIEVARRLHLDERVIIALEQDHYEGLPAPTFVRGYLASYARMLGLPVEPVLEAFKAAKLSAPALQLEIDNGDTRDARETHARGMPWLTLGAAAAVVAGYAIWESATVPPPGSSKPVATAGAAVAPSAPAGTVQAQSAASTDATPPVDASTTTSATLGTIARQPAGAAGAASANSPTAPSLAPASPAASSPAPSATPLAPASTAAAADAAPPAVPQANTAMVDPAAATPAATAAEETSQAPRFTDSSGLAQLQITFPAESWVEIHDVDGKRLFWDLVKAGRNLTLVGKPPLKVLVGKADGARVTYGSVQVNIVGFVRRGMARFILDADSATPRPWP